MTSALSKQRSKPTELNDQKSEYFALLQSECKDNKILIFLHLPSTFFYQLQVKAFIDGRTGSLSLDSCIPGHGTGNTEFRINAISEMNSYEYIQYTAGLSLLLAIVINRIRWF